VNINPHGAKAFCQTIFNGFRNLMGGLDIGSIHDQVHFNKDLTAQETARGNAVAVEDSGYLDYKIVNCLGSERQNYIQPGIASQLADQRSQSG